MFEELGDILETLKIMVKQMDRSNENMEKLTKQLELISLPPDMVKWAKKKYPQERLE